MDSKIVGVVVVTIIVIIIGLIGASNVGNESTGPTVNLIPKVLDVVSIDGKNLEVNIQFTNQGDYTLYNIKGYLEIDGKYHYYLKAIPSNVMSNQTVILIGSINDVSNDSDLNIVTTKNISTPEIIWDVYPGKSILLRVSGDTASGNMIEKKYTITVK